MFKSSTDRPLHIVDQIFQSSDSSTSWPNAKVECEQISGSLITINSIDEQRYGQDQGERYKDNVWIGLTEMVRY